MWTGVESVFNFQFLDSVKITSELTFLCFLLHYKMEQLSPNTVLSSSEIEQLCDKDLFKQTFKRFKLLKFDKAKGQQVRSASDFARNIPCQDDNNKDNICFCSRHILLNSRCKGAVKEIALRQDLRNLADSEVLARLGLRHPTEWDIFELEFPAGLILIRNPFTGLGQRYWIRRSVQDFPQSPHVTNIQNLQSKEGRSKQHEAKDTEEFYRKLRWATFGYHHNWDTKVYSEDSKCDFPSDLGELTKLIANLLGFKDFKAEAAIANYYHMDSTLSGHVDRSEANQEAPLFSLSFGQSAVFLIGGRLKSVEPQAIHVRSGDVVIMSGESRFSYHAVPKIFQAEDEPWNYDSTCDNCDVIVNKKPKLEGPSIDKSPISVEWNDFLDSYSRNSRINLNIRQVLFPGDEELSQSFVKFKEINKNN